MASIARPLAAAVRSRTWTWTWL